MRYILLNQRSIFNCLGRMPNVTNICSFNYYLKFYIKQHTLIAHILYVIFHPFFFFQKMLKSILIGN